LGIIQAKLEIFSQEKTKIKIFNHQLKEQTNEDFSSMTSFSIKERSADFFLAVSEGRVFVDEKGVRAAEVDLSFSEDHLLEDFLAATAVVRTLGMSWQEILERVSFLRLPKMRFERFEKEGVLFINDAYNANPESMRAALQNLPKAKEGKKRIAVLGSMKELGEFSKSSHEEIGRKALECVDHILCLGQECETFVEIFQTAKKPAEMFFEHGHLAKRLKELIEPGDVVLIKGSRSIELEKVLQCLDTAGA
jgi:UDP-N-acetylmuramoyl-tripeptide--D-alanyl-D-alanine ligase